MATRCQHSAIILRAVAVRGPGWRASRDREPGGLGDASRREDVFVVEVGGYGAVGEDAAGGLGDEAAGQAASSVGGVGADGEFVTVGVVSLHSNGGGVAAVGVEGGQDLTAEGPEPVRESGVVGRHPCPGVVGGDRFGCPPEHRLGDPAPGRPTAAGSQVSRGASGGGSGRCSMACGGRDSTVPSGVRRPATSRRAPSQPGVVRAGLVVRTSGEVGGQVPRASWTQGIAGSRRQRRRHQRAPRARCRERPRPSGRARRAGPAGHRPRRR